MIRPPKAISYQFKPSRINASGLKFESAAAQALAREIGNLPAQAHRARQILQLKERPA